ncbi:hypothetical protein EDD70_0215 [Hydrogenoanaerobacterium saccharovorans]|uniref:DUF4190 domain-containing protein n=1 Tax=Hydrogenoanaerobacterium saccharovorans TaxID=474960 RepID=A0A1H8BGU6_9FIRM|nr:DUF4190 domain-containing protein [Hydrogenoanaerobacterium saccharovorans]RPF47430.1 hypothetical protein EDD70_0215 [Hydrogenoanaerobacterium saccharovorans]SEM81689.1 hypothetical protein SAMN05216180_1878 [Hydrogenoanaerobacterium saccharovorans]
MTDFKVNKPDDFIKFVSEDFFAKEGFELDKYKGNEVVWRKGMGLMTSPQFMKLAYQNGNVHLEAWMPKFALPGIYFGETGITGAYGWAVKSALKNRVDTLIGLLNQDVNIPGYNAPAVQGAQGGQAAAQAVQTAPVTIPVAVHDPKGKATLSLVMGLVGLVAWLIPLAGFICGIVGITSGVVGRKSSSKGKATAGLVLSILSIVFTVGNWLLGILFAAAGML